MPLAYPMGWTMQGSNPGRARDLYLFQPTSSLAVGLYRRPIQAVPRLFPEDKLAESRSMPLAYPMGWTMEGSNPGRARDLYLFQKVQPGCGALPASNSGGTEALSRG